MSPQRLAGALPEGFLATKLPPQEPLQLRNSKSQRPRRPSQSRLEVPPCEKREPTAFSVGHRAPARQTAGQSESKQALAGSWPHGLQAGWGCSHETRAGRGGGVRPRGWGVTC